MITFQNVPSEAQFNKFFVSQKSYVAFLIYSSFCIFNHPMSYQIFDVLMSVSTLDRVHFWMYLLNDNSLTHEIWSVDRCQQGQYFSEIFSVIWGTGTKLQTLFNFATCSNYLITNYVKFPVSFQVSLYCHCNKIIKGPGTSF